MAYPKEKRIHLAKSLVIHMILDLQTSIGLCLSFKPLRVTSVATIPINKQTPKRTNLTATIGKQTANFNHLYSPSIQPVLLKNGSTVDDPHTSRPLDPRNSYAFSLLLTIILLPLSLPLSLLWWEFWWMWFIELSLLLLLSLWERESWMVRIRLGGSEWGGGSTAWRTGREGS